MVATGPAMTVTFALPLIVPDVAVTLSGYEPIVLPAVKSPVAATIVPGGLVALQTGVMATVFPKASFPTAVNCCCVPITRVGFGVTVIVASGPAVMITVAVAVMPRQVARIVLVYVPGTVLAVKTPVEGLIVPPPATTDQTTAPAFGTTEAPVKSVPDVVNCTVPPAATVAGLGATTSVESTPGSLVSLHEVAAAPSATA